MSIKNPKKVINEFASGEEVHEKDKTTFFDKISKFFGIGDLKALWHIATHRDCAKNIFSATDIAIIIAGVAYVVMPLDAIPDFIPIAGMLDDVAIVTYILNNYADLIKKYKDSCM